jgi:RNA polymerase sigma-70 factor (ECF subfamily)
MVEVQDRTRESFQRLASVVLPTLYWLARLHRGRKRFEQELWAYAQETGLLLKGTVQ